MFPYRIIQAPIAEDISAIRDAYHYAKLSNDPSTQVGAVVGATGAFNGQVDRKPPEGTDKWWSLLHAEERVLLIRAREGYSCKLKTMHAPWAACVECAPAILEAGIRRLVVHHQIMEKTPERWVESVTQGLDMLVRHGVSVEALDMTFGITLRFDGREITV